MRIQENYERIKKSLTSDIQKLEEAINLIEDFKAHKQERSSKDFSDLENQIRRINDKMSAQGAEDIALMLEAKSRKRKNKKKADYQPFLIINERFHGSNDKLFLNFLASIDINKPFHYDIILFSESGHCTPLQIHSDGSEIKMFFVDAAGDPGNLQTKQDIEKSLGVSSYQNLNTQTQNDGINCSIYSIQDLNSLSKLTQESLQSSFNKETEENNSIMHPKFIKNAQSSALINEYKNKATEESLRLSDSKTLAEYLNNYSASVEITDVSNGEKAIKEKNYAILYKKHKYLSAALAVLEESTPEQLEEIFQERKAFNMLNEYKATMNLTNEQKMLLRGIYNSKQIDLILNYGVGERDIFNNNSPCFYNNKMTEKAIEFITKDINHEAINDEQKQVIKNRFNKIKELKTLPQLEAVINFNLNEKDVLKAECFKASNRIELAALSCIQHAYNNGGEEAARTVFYKIHNASYFKFFDYNKDYKINKNELWVASLSWGRDTEYAIKLVEEEFDKNGDSRAKALFDKIKSLRNTGQFKTVLDYDLDPDEVKYSYCFDNYQVNQEALKLIDEAFQASGKNGAKALFDKIKSLSDIEQFKAVLDYGLDPEEVLQARCYYTQHTVKQEAVKLIDEAFKASGKDGAKALLDKIKSLSNIEQFKAVLDHGLDSNDVKNSDCFSDASQEALELIKNASNSKETFNKIKTLRESTQFKAVLDYGLDPEEVLQAQCISPYYTPLTVRQEALKLIDEAFKKNGKNEAKALLDKIKDFDSIEQFKTFLSLEEKTVKTEINVAEVKNEAVGYDEQIQPVAVLDSEEVNMTHVTDTINYDEHTPTSNPAEIRNESIVSPNEQTQHSRALNQEALSTKLLQTIKDASGYFYDDEKKWQDVAKTLSSIPSEDRANVVSSLLHNIPHNRQDRLIALLNEKDQRNITKPTLAESLRNILDSYGGVGEEHYTILNNQKNLKQGKQK